MRRESVYVYRRRRLGVGLIGLTLIVLLSQVIGPCANSGGGDEAATTTTTVAPTTTTTLPAPPACAVGDQVIPDDPAAAWDRIIVDTTRRLAPTFVPPDLVDASEAGFPTGFRVRAIVVDDLRAMREAAAANGTPIGLIATFRTYEQQADLYARREQQLGAEVARTRAARAGHSEHQLGTAIDVGDEGDIDVTQAWGETPTARWVAEHAHEYGFVLTLPANKAAVTCYDYEPWHLRYIGRDRAAAVKASGLTLREFLWAESQGARPSPASTTTTTTAATTTTPE
jgi:D-alanyl-D-alanine carboxypeptidase